MHDIPVGSDVSVVVDVPDEYGRVALLSDVHGNAAALDAVLGEVEAAGVDAVCHLGDLTWGPHPHEVLERLAALPVPVHHVRGNAERLLVDVAAGRAPHDSPRFAWIIDRLGVDGLAGIGAFPPSLRIRIGAVGALRLCHGSPRSDIELLTPGRDPEAVREAASGLDGERGFAHGHTHVQYRREVGHLLVIAPGSVGESYGEAGPGARWALAGDGIDGGVELRTTAYDVDAAIASARAVGYPGVERYEEILRRPPTLEWLEADAATRGFAE